MLKGVPPVISPDLMAAMMRMGHGDELVLADGHFPADSHARRVVRADGLGLLALLEAVLRFFPIDRYVADAAVVMRPVEAQAADPPIWDDFRRLLRHSEGRPVELTAIERFAFYERSRQAYVIVATSDTAMYGNLILKKGHAGP